MFNDVLYSDTPLVTSAPTGSGKTVLFELAIVRLLIQMNHNPSGVKIIYGKDKNTSLKLMLTV